MPILVARQSFSDDLLRRVSSGTDLWFQASDAPNPSPSPNPNQVSEKLTLTLTLTLTQTQTLALALAPTLTR